MGQASSKWDSFFFFNSGYFCTFEKNIEGKDSDFRSSGNTDWKYLQPCLSTNFCGVEKVKIKIKNTFSMRIIMHISKPSTARAGNRDIMHLHFFLFKIFTFMQITLLF